MDTTVWESVLIEWVNCLKLSKIVVCLDDLRQGDFFINIQKLIKKESLDTCMSDVLFNFNVLLNQNYPNIQCAWGENLSIMCERELKLLTTLLMHYTCIFDRRDVLTSPLCHSLLQGTQICIRNFLEKVTKDVSQERLNEIIGHCIKLDKKHSNDDQWSSEGPYLTSPLQNLLKTPVPKTARLQKKDREIGQLKSELELERYEKVDLQQELASCTEKLSKLEKQLDQKCLENSRLKSEVLALEERTPPNFQDKDSRKIQKILKEEIKSLEDYIQKIELEGDTIRKERDLTKEQVTKLESQCVIWQKKFFEVEKLLETCTERSVVQEKEILNLQNTCDELTALLEEYKDKQPENDSYIFETLQAQSQPKNGPNSNCEDLASSVVEVQLLDMKKQNEELESRIKALHANNDELMLEAEKTVARVTETQKQIDLANVVVKEKESVIQQHLEELNKVNHELKEITQTSNDLKTKLTVSNDNNIKNTEIINRLNVEKDELRNTKTMLEENLQETQKEVNNLNEYISTLKETISSLENDLTIKLQESEVLREELSNANESIKKFKSEITLKTEKLNSLQTENAKLESHIKTFEEIISQYESDLTESKEDNFKLRSEHELLNIALTSCRNENERLVQREKELTQQCLECNKKIENLSQEIRRLKDDQQNSEDNLRELSAVKTNLQLNVKELSAENNNLLQEIQLQKNHFEDEKSVLVMENNALIEENETFKTENEQISENLKTILKELENVKILAKEHEMKLIEEIENQRIKIDNSNTKVKDLSQEIKHLTANLQNSQDSLKKLSTLKNNLEQQCENLSSENKKLLHEINDKQRTLEHLEQEKSNILSKNNALIEENETFKTENEQISENLKTILQELENVKIFSKEHEQKLIEEIENQKIKIENFIIEVEDLSQEIEHLKVNLQNSQDSLEELSTLKTNLEQHCEKLSTENKKLLHEINDIQTTLEQEKSILMTENNALIKENESFKSENHQISENLKKIVKEGKHVRNLGKEHEEKMTQKIINIEDTYSVLDKLYKKLFEEHSQILEEKKQLEQNLIQIKQNEEQREKQFTEISSTLKELNQEYSNSNNMIFKLESESNSLVNSVQNFECLVKDQKEEINKLTQQNLTMENTNLTLAQNLKQCSAFMESLLKDQESFKTAVTKNITSKSNKIVSLNQKINIIGDQLQEKQFKEKELSDIVEHLTKVLEKYEKEKATLQEQFNSVQQDCNKMYTMVSAKNQELNLIIHSIREKKRQTNNLIEQLQLSVSDCYNKVEQIATRIDSFENLSDLPESTDVELSKLDDFINKINDYIIYSNEMQNLYLKEISALKEVLAETINNNTNLIEEQKEFKIENDAHVTSLTENLHNLVQKFNELEIKYKESLDVIATNEETKKALKNIKSKLEQDVHNFKQQLLHKDEQINDLQVKITKKDSIINENAQEIDTLNNNYQNYNLKTEFTITELETKVKNANHEIKLLTEDNLKLNEVIKVEKKNHDDENKTFEENLNSKVQNIQNLESCIRELESKNEILAKEKLINAEQMEIVNCELTDFKNKSQTTNAELEKNVQNLNMIIEQNKAEKVTLENMTTKLENEKKHILEDLASLEAKLKESEEKYDHHSKTTKDQLNTITVNYECLQKDFTQKQNEIAQLQNQISELKINNANLKIQKDGFENMLHGNKEDNLKELQRIEAHYENVLEEHKSTFDNLKMINEKVSDELNSTKIEVQNLHDKVEYLTKEKQELEVDLNELNFKLTKKSNEVRMLEENLMEQELTLAESKGVIDENLGVIKSLRNKNENLRINVDALAEELTKVKQNRDQVLESQKKLIEETEGNILRAHENAIEVKNQEHKLKQEVDAKLTKEIETNKSLNMTISSLESEINKLQIANSNLSEDVAFKTKQITTKETQLQTLETELQKLKLSYAEKEILLENETHKFETLKTEFDNIIMLLQRITEFDVHNLDDIENLDNQLIRKLADKVRALLEQIDLFKKDILKYETAKIDFETMLHKLEMEKQNQVEISKKIKDDYNTLLTKYDELQNAKTTEVENEQKSLQAVNKIIESYQSIKTKHKTYKEKIQLLLTQKGTLDSILTNMRHNLADLQTSLSAINGNKQTIEKKEELDIISDDIFKVYNKYSKQINDLLFEMTYDYERKVESVFIKTETKIENNNNFNMEEFMDKMSDLTDRAVDAVEQLKTLRKSVELSSNSMRISAPKENILTSSNKSNLSIDNLKENEWKKKVLALKQKLTLSENAKSNLEKKIKQLREENKKLSDRPDSLNNDVHYKMLLQQHLQSKDEHEGILKDCTSQYEQLLKEYNDYKENTKNVIVKQEQLSPSSDKTKLEIELTKLRDAYSAVVVEHSRTENENLSLRRTIEERTAQLGDFSLIKEAYDKLLEENSKLMTEVDTVKYKRSRDREEYVRLLKKEKDEFERKEAKRIQEIRAEYESKLEKMKDKMIKLYRDEVNKEMNKVKIEQNENTSLANTVDDLKARLFESDQQIHLLEKERQMLKNRIESYDRQLHSSRESLASLRSNYDAQSRAMTRSSVSSSQIPSRGSSRDIMENKSIMQRTSSLSGRGTQRFAEEIARRTSTLPARSRNGMDDSVVSRRMCDVPDSIGENIQMEDEEEMFNNKYLTDLKDGKCVLPPSGRESTASRLSELAYRNSLVPPHLKSSYPGETQFCSPTHFKEDEIKSGHIGLDDSHCKLLPNEKRRKDFGTTSYKKPGPPTPSKNGGRLSLQGNEVHPIRESTEPKTPKRSTPSRIRALFSGRNINSKAEEQKTTPKGNTRRLSNIFKKPK